MKISTKVRYGIKALKYIAKESSQGRLVRINEVTLHDLYVILDEDIKIIDCNEPTENKKVCSDDGCSSECIWGQMDVAMREIMKSKTLEDLLENSHEIIGE